MGLCSCWYMFVLKLVYGCFCVLIWLRIACLFIVCVYVYCILVFCLIRVWVVVCLIWLDLRAALYSIVYLLLTARMGVVYVCCWIGFASCFGLDGWFC